MDDKQFFQLEKFINRIIEKKLSTMNLHQKVFPQFKGIYSGKEVVVIAAAPSAKYYKPIENAIHIGVNRAIDLPVNLDYLFIQDVSGAWDYLSRITEYKPDTCKKFYGLTTEWTETPNRVIPEDEAIKANAYRYRTDWEDIPGFECKFAYDLSSQSLGCFGSITFPALQFALWTNPSKIYLVGCDTSNAGYFDNSNTKNFLLTDRIIEAHKKFKIFAKTYYSKTEIISINPVGLKGIYKDIYTIGG